MENNSITKNKIIGFFKLTFIVTILNIIVTSLMYGANPIHFLNPLDLISFSSSLNRLPFIIGFYPPPLMYYLLIIVGWLINYFISIKIFLPKHKNNGVEKTGKNDNKKVASSSLTEKYKILISYRTLTYLSMLLYTGFSIYLFAEIVDMGSGYEKALILISVFYIINMFCLFCLSLIISFLFDLDKK